VFAHIAGVPVEETALNLAPVAATVATAAGVKLRGRVRRAERPGRTASGVHARTGRTQRQAAR